MGYQLIDDTTILRTEDGVYIPVNEGNKDYQAYLEWAKKKRNKPLPPPDQAAASSEPMTALQKLEAVGLTVDELRQLLFSADQVGSPAKEAAPGVRPPRPSGLGEEWLDADGTRWIAAQAFDANGQFAADDPSTEERESLEWVKADPEGAPTR